MSSGASGACARGRVEVYARVRPADVARGGADDGGGGAGARTVRVARRDGGQHRAGEARVVVDASCGGGGGGGANHANARAFDVDGAFDVEATQCEVYAACAAPVLEAATKGYRGCVLAYGQTGSGKTYSMLNAGDGEGGDAGGPGLVPRLAVDCFARAASDSFHAYEVSCAMAQIYNEQVDDLVAKRAGLKVVPASDGSGYDVEGLLWTPCRSAEDVLECFKRGRSRLVYAETHMNKQSSRSHCVFQMKIDRIERPVDVISSSGSVVRDDECAEVHGDDGDDGRRVAVEMRSGLLTIVDLAGSERQKKTQSIGARFKEATNINTSLLALGNVVSALAAGHRYIPYRDSTLTKILESSLNGKSRTTLLVCVSAEAQHANESANSLDFATRAMRIETSPEVRSSLVDMDPRRLTQQLRGQANDEALTRVMREVDALRRALANANKSSEEDIMALKHSRDALTNELCTTRLNLEACKAALERVRSESATTTRDLLVMQTANATLEHRTKTLTIKLSAKSGEMHNQRAAYELALSQMEKSTRKLESQLNAERASTSRALKRVEALTKSCTEVRSANVNLERASSLMNIELERARSMVGAHRVDNARLMRRHVALEAKQNDSVRECAELRQQALIYFVKYTYGTYRHDVFANMIAAHDWSMKLKCREAETRRERDSIARRAAARRSVERSALVLALEKDKLDASKRLRRAERRGSEIDERYVQDVALLRAEMDAQRHRLDVVTRLHNTTADRQLERGVIITKVARNGKRYDRILRVNSFTGALESAQVPRRFKLLAPRRDVPLASPTSAITPSADDDTTVDIVLSSRNLQLDCAHGADAVWALSLAKRFGRPTGGFHLDTSPAMRRHTTTQI